MIQKAHLKLLGTAAGLLLVATGLLVFFVFTIIHEADRLSEEIVLVSKDQSQQIALAQLRRLARETETDRALVESFYLQSQSDTIDLLNFIEQTANQSSITLVTESATELARQEQSYLEVRYLITGTRSNVQSFTELLEAIPYVSTLSEVSLVAKHTDLWEARVALEVMLLQYESDT